MSQNITEIGDCENVVFVIGLVSDKVAYKATADGPHFLFQLMDKQHPYWNIPYIILLFNTYKMKKEIHNKLKWYEIPMAVVVIIMSAHLMGNSYEDKKNIAESHRWRIGK